MQHPFSSGAQYKGQQQTFPGTHSQPVSPSPMHSGPPPFGQLPLDDELDELLDDELLDELEDEEEDEDELDDDELDDDELECLDELPLEEFSLLLGWLLLLGLLEWLLLLPLE